MGPPGSTAYIARDPDVEWNAVSNLYLVVWDGDDDADGVDDETEIYFQLLDNTGAEIGSDTRLSHMGPDGATDYDARSPAVAFSTFSQEYLVVWEADSDMSPTNSEFEIFGQRLSAGGLEVGATDFRISFMGPENDPQYEAHDPDVVWNPVSSEYLVVWNGADNTNSLVAGEQEIYLQRLGADGTPLGSSERISDMHIDGESSWDADSVAVAAKSACEYKYLIVWEGEDDPAHSSHLEIYVQLWGETNKLCAPIPVITDIVLQGSNTVVVYWTATNGFFYNLKAATNLESAAWYGVPGATNLAGQSPVMPGTGTISKLIEFYRIEAVP